MSEDRIRAAIPADAAALTDLAFTSKAHWGYPQPWLEAWRADLTFEPSYIEQFPVYLAEDGHGPTSAYALKRLSDDLISLDHFWVHPRAMGRGLGRTMFGDAAARATEMKATHLEIDADPNAASFYEHLGCRWVRDVEAPVLGTPRSRPIYLYPLSSSKEIKPK